MDYKKVKGIPHQDLTDWFAKMSDRDIVAYRLIGGKIKAIKVIHKIDDCRDLVLMKEVPQWIALCRKDMETRYQKTLYCVRGVGYKVATPRELAIYTAKFLRRTLTHADRTMRLADIVDRRQMPEAIREVFFDQTGKVKKFKGQGLKFMTQFTDFLKEETKQRSLTHNDKRIEIQKTPTTEKRKSAIFSRTAEA